MGLISESKDVVVDDIEIQADQDNLIEFQVDVSGASVQPVCRLVLETCPGQGRVFLGDVSDAVSFNVDGRGLRGTYRGELEILLGEQRFVPLRLVFNVVDKPQVEARLRSVPRARVKATLSERWRASRGAERSR